VLWSRGQIDSNEELIWIWGRASIDLSTGKISKTSERIITPSKNASDGNVLNDTQIAFWSREDKAHGFFGLSIFATLQNTYGASIYFNDLLTLLKLSKSSDWLPIGAPQFTRDNNHILITLQSSSGEKHSYLLTYESGKPITKFIPALTDITNIHGAPRLDNDGNIVFVQKDGDNYKLMKVPPFAEASAGKPANSTDLIEQVVPTANLLTNLPKYGDRFDFLETHGGAGHITVERILKLRISRDGKHVLLLIKDPRPEGIHPFIAKIENGNMSEPRHLVNENATAGFTDFDFGTTDGYIWTYRVDRVPGTPLAEVRMRPSSYELELYSREILIQPQLGFIHGFPPPLPISANHK
jgi:hypothetical protein